jgi:hypothetical protein
MNTSRKNIGSLRITLFLAAFVFAHFYAMLSISSAQFPPFPRSAPPPPAQFQYARNLAITDILSGHSLTTVRSIGLSFMFKESHPNILLYTLDAAKQVAHWGTIGYDQSWVLEDMCCMKYGDSIANLFVAFTVGATSRVFSVPLDFDNLSHEIFGKSIDIRNIPNETDTTLYGFAGIEQISQIDGRLFLATNKDSLIHFDVSNGVLGQSGGYRVKVQAPTWRFQNSAIRLKYTRSKATKRRTAGGWSAWACRDGVCACSLST